MDEEDLAEQADSQILQTNDFFALFGSKMEDSKRESMAIDLLRSQGETMGVKLLRKMGWRDGYGLGSCIGQECRLQDSTGSYLNEKTDNPHFAKEKSKIIAFIVKHERHGIDYDGAIGLEQDGSKSHSSETMSDPSNASKTFKGSAFKSPRAGFGAGILDDAGSDDEDPYEMGPKISYNRTIGREKKGTVKLGKKRKPIALSSNPQLVTKPAVFTSRRPILSGFRKCSDGRLPLDGFVLFMSLDSSSNGNNLDRYPLPDVPSGWAEVKLNSRLTHRGTKQPPSIQASEASLLDPKSRAAMLGEAQLPGKSVFDFLSPASREKIASVTGRANLPPAKGETLPSALPTRTLDTQEEIPSIDTEVAMAALGRGLGGWMPYADEPAKRDRYRGFLELHGGLRKTLPDRPVGFKQDAWMQEMHEFAHAARVFKPMTGAMASRFQSSSTTAQNNTHEGTDAWKRPVEQAKDPAEVAASMGLFGPLTRTVLTFFPTRLLCKRFNVKVPDHVTVETEGQAADESKNHWREERLDRSADATTRSEPPDRDSRMDEEVEMPFAGSSETTTSLEKPLGVDAEINDALERSRAGNEIFRAIFGDESD